MEPTTLLLTYVPLDQKPPPCPGWPDWCWWVIRDYDGPPEFKESPDPDTWVVKQKIKDIEFVRGRKPNIDSIGSKL